MLEDKSDAAQELYGNGDHLVAPRLITTEIANALVSKTMQGMLTYHEAAYHFGSLGQFDLMEVDELIAPAFENACTLRHPIYEAARRLDAQLVTADRKFIAELAGNESAHHVMSLSDWRSE